MQKPSHQYDAYIRQVADVHLPGIDWRLLKAQYIAESNLDPNAKSSAGAMGIAQIMPGTWLDESTELGYPNGADPYDPHLSIRLGAHYMSKMLSGWTAPRPDIDRYCLALASYNAGFGHILDAQKLAGGANDYATIIQALPRVTGPKNSAQTIKYVKRILRHFNGLVTG